MEIIGMGKEEVKYTPKMQIEKKASREKSVYEMDSWIFYNFGPNDIGGESII
jgi:hypothetical protein